VLAALGAGGLFAPFLSGFEYPIHTLISVLYALASIASAVLLWHMSEHAYTSFVVWIMSVAAYLAAYQFGRARGSWAAFLGVVALYTFVLFWLHRYVRTKLRAAA
jgi:hypothetical protein